MSTEPDRDEGGTVLNVYVPEHERAEWADHADELGLELSRFVRELVQAGQRTWYSEKYSDTTSEMSAGSGGDLEDQIIETLAESDPMKWNELVEALTGNLERRINQAMDNLEGSGAIVYDRPSERYSLAGDNEPQ